MKTLHHLIVVSLVLLASGIAQVFGQVEGAAPGNLRGIRVDGELMAFSTSIRAIVPTAADDNQGGRRGGSVSFISSSPSRVVAQASSGQ